MPTKHLILKSISLPLTYDDYDIYGLDINIYKKIGVTKWFQTFPV
jgi:hypothetical protein